MARMRGFAQSIDDPHIEALERLDTLGGQAAQIAGISERAEAKSERGNVAVGLEARQHLDRAALPAKGDGLAGHQPVLVEDRRVFAAGRGREAVAKTFM